MFQQLLVSKHHRLRDSKFGRVEAWVCSHTSRQKKKPQVNHEPCSAHGRAVKKTRVNQEPRSAHGCAVNENQASLTALKAERNTFGLPACICACFCVAYMKCIATLCHNLIYLFICLRESALVTWSCVVLCTSQSQPLRL